MAIIFSFQNFRTLWREKSAMGGFLAAAASALREKKFAPARLAFSHMQILRRLSHQSRAASPTAADEEE